MPDLGCGTGEVLFVQGASRGGKASTLSGSTQPLPRLYRGAGNSSTLQSDSRTGKPVGGDDLGLDDCGLSHACTLKVRNLPLHGAN